MFDALLSHMETLEKSELLAGLAQGEEQFKQGGIGSLLKDCKMVGKRSRSGQQ